jgi:hypothetical protein
VQLPADVVSPGTVFHADQAGWDVGQPLRDPGPGSLIHSTIVPLAPGACLIRIQSQNGILTLLACGNLAFMSGSAYENRSRRLNEGGVSTIWMSRASGESGQK